MLSLFSKRSYYLGYACEQSIIIVCTYQYGSLANTDCKDETVMRLNYIDSVKAPIIIEMKPITVRIHPVQTEYLMALCE
jgi:hypothetical protein